MGLISILFAWVTCFMIAVQAREKPNFAAAKDEIFKATNLIYQRYEYHKRRQYQFFLGSMNLANRTWDLMKYKFAMKILSGDQSDYTMLFGGSSVTAGHDNYFNQSYPLVVERRLKPAFDALGINLVVRNIAMGTNPCRPYEYCYNTQGDEQADWIGWEQAYNCGKDRGAHELIARVAYFNKAVMFYTASGAFIPSTCKPSTDRVPWISESWTPELESIPARQSPSRNDVDEHKALMHRWFEDSNAAGRFAGPLRGYDAVGSHGFSVWAHSSRLCDNYWANSTGNCDAINMKGACQGENEWGMHWLVLETAIYGQDGGHGGGWHPSVGIHLMRGETMAYNYAYILLDAINEVEAALAKSADVEAIRKGFEREYNKLFEPVPQTLYCGDECVHKPKCYTDYKPHFNPKNYLEDIIIGTNGWIKVLKPTPLNNKYGQIEGRDSYEINGKDAEIHFKVDVGSAKRIHVCGNNAKESLKYALFYLDLDVKNRTETYKPSSQRVLIHGKDSPKFARKHFGDECTALFNLPPGNHVLTAKANPDYLTHTSTISHVILFE